MRRNISPQREQEILAYLEKYPDKSQKETASAFGVNTWDIANIKFRNGVTARPRNEARSLDEVLKLEHEKDAKKSERKKLDILVDEVERLQKEKEALLAIKAGPSISEIRALHPSGTSEATYFTLASDWHIEERVRREEVNNLNEFNLEVAHERTTKFFQKGLRLYRMFAQDVRIDHWVIPLLGDFITGNIHEEFLETTQLAPAEAIWEAQNIIASGIDFLLNHTKAKLTFPCKSGNHGRITKDQRHATEEGNSLESFMYRNLANHYAKEKRVNFILSDGYHIYLDVYGRPLRIHHGHAMNYGGGVGGLYIPVNKAIAQWNKARRAELDLFGHFHQFRYGGNFIVNGSLIGYNSYALGIKAEFERPQQASFLFDKKRGVSIVAPLLFEE